MFPELKVVEQDDVLKATGNFDGLSVVTLELNRANPREAHIHGVPVFIIPIEGLCATLAGPDMDVWLHTPGSIMKIAAGVPHVGVSLDWDVPVVAHKFSVSPDIKADTSRLPEYDELVNHRTNELLALYQAGELDLASRTSGFVTVRQTVERFVDGH